MRAAGTNSLGGGISRGDPVGVVPGVGAVTARRLAAAGLGTTGAVLLHVPARYRRLVRYCSSEETTDRTAVFLEGVVLGARRMRLPGRRSLVTVELRVVPSGEVVTARFFNQPWTAEQAVPERSWCLWGVLRLEHGKAVLTAPRRLAETPAGAEFLLPVYTGLPRGFGPVRFGRLVARLLPEAERIVPEDLGCAFLKRAGMLALPEAVRSLHRPGPEQDLEPARRRVAFEEARAALRAVRLRRRRREQRRAPTLAPPRAALARIEARLPFRLSREQRRAAAEILADLARPRPMARLLQGEVGSGKTAVAFFAALACAACGAKAVVLAPTEVLAQQHHARFARWLAGARLPLLAVLGSQDGAAREAAARRLAAPGPALVVGTHALFDERLEIRGLGLLVVDEQQRFGVRQRAALYRPEGGLWPHVLVMTATPIPRTLATALYGDLDLSEIRRPPVPRRPVRTLLMPEDRWPRVRAAVVREVQRGGRVFVVCPRIGGAGDGAGALATHAELAALVPAALVHGRMPAAERRRALADFASGRIGCLVGTTVLEVGIDVPEATWMVVRGADRLGSAALHQLRGRVGRGGRRALCLFLAASGFERLEEVRRSTDGFAVAEADLRRRGAGDLAGALQHGRAAFRCLDPFADLDLLRLAADGRLQAGQPPG